MDWFLFLLSLVFAFLSIQFTDNWVYGWILIIFYAVTCIYLVNITARYTEKRCRAEDFVVTITPKDGETCH